MTPEAFWAEWNFLSRSDLKMTFWVLTLALIFVVAYCFRVLKKGRAHFERVEKQKGSIFLSKAFLEAGYWVIQPVGKLLVSLRIHPHVLSWGCLFFAALSALSFAFGHFGSGGAFAICSGYLDALDGMVARTRGLDSPSGAILDTSIDRYAEALFLGGLIIHYRAFPAVVLLLVFNLLGAFMVSYGSALARNLRVQELEGPMRRPERAFYWILGAILSPISYTLFEEGPFHWGYPMLVALILVGVVSNISAIERLMQIARLAESKKRDEIREQARGLDAEGILPKSNH